MTDVYVIGSSLPALASALEFAEVGLRVRIALDPRDRSIGVDGVSDHDEVRDHNDNGDHDGVRDHDGALAAFLAHIGTPLKAGDAGNREASRIETPPQRVQLRNAKGGWTPQPTPSVIGIPAVPMDAQSMAILGGAGAARASIDRIKPVLTIGKVHELGTLVRNRLGKVALERLVDPFVRDRFGAAPDDVEVALAAPGLNEAVTRAGSLSGAALALADRDVARETRVAPRGGWRQLRDAVLSRLQLFGADIVQAIPNDARPTEGGWKITEEDGERFEARVIVADFDSTAPEAVSAARGLVAPEAWRSHARAEIEAPELDDPEIGTLQSVSLPSGEMWSIRCERDGSDRWSASAAGPRFTRSADAFGPGSSREVEQARDDAQRALSIAGLTASGAFNVALRPAPHLSLERRNVETIAREALREAEPGLLLVGSALFAGDLADAIADARSVSIGARRRLTGIAE